MTRFASQGLCPTKRGPDTKGTKPQPKKHQEESSLGFLVPFSDPHCASCGSFPFLLGKAPVGGIDGNSGAIVLGCQVLFVAAKVAFRCNVHMPPHALRCEGMCITQQPQWTDGAFLQFGSVITSRAVC